MRVSLEAASVVLKIGTTPTRENGEKRKKENSAEKEKCSKSAEKYFRHKLKANVVESLGGIQKDVDKVMKKKNNLTKAEKADSKT